MYRGHDATLEVNIVSKKQKLHEKKVAIEKSIPRKCLYKTVQFFSYKVNFYEKLRYTF